MESSSSHKKRTCADRNRHQQHDGLSSHFILSLGRMLTVGRVVAPDTIIFISWSALRRRRIYSSCNAVRVGVGLYNSLLMGFSAAPGVIPPEENEVFIQCTASRRCFHKFYPMDSVLALKPGGTGGYHLHRVRRALAMTFLRHWEVPTNHWGRTQRISTDMRNHILSRDGFW